MYQSALRRFSEFCSLYNVLTQFTVSEAFLCYYTVYIIPSNGQTISSDNQLVAIRHMQITMGLPEFWGFSTMPCLWLVQSGINQTNTTQASTKVRLPITPAILHSLKEHWSPQRTNRDIIMMWVAVFLCFFGFFWSGKITVPTEKLFDPTKHLAWETLPLTTQRTLSHSKCA